MKDDKYEVRFYWEGGLACPDPRAHYERTKVLTREQWALENPVLAAEEDLKELLAVTEAVDKLFPSPSITSFILFTSILLIIFSLALYTILTI